MTTKTVNEHAVGQSRSTVGLGSAFQQAVHHAYAQTDGTYAWPNSREGDMLKQAKREIEELRKAIKANAIKPGFTDMLEPWAALVLMPPNAD